jgi:hypothetical protein
MQKSVQNILLVAGLLCIMYYAKMWLESTAYGLDLEKFFGGNGVTFLSAAETAKFIRKDGDNYVHAMTPWDLYARRVKTPEEYMERAAAAAIDFSPADKEKYSKAAEDADAVFMRLGHEIIAAMQWKLALTTGDAYEAGMPHTRMDTIFLASKGVIRGSHAQLVETLVHEKLHLFQRANPDKMIHLLARAGYTRWKLRAHEPRIRANPDLDPYIYIDPATEKPMAAYYTSDTPYSISDIDVAPRDEHPFERMAYELVKKI